MAIFLKGFGLLSVLDQYFRVEIGAVVFLFSLMCLNYFLYIRGDKYKEIIAESDKEGKHYSRFSFVFGLVFTIGGYIFPILMILLNAKTVD